MWEKLKAFMYKHDLEFIPYMLGFIVFLILFVSGLLNWSCSGVAELYNTDYKVVGMSCYLYHDGKWLNEVYFRWMMAQ